MSEATHPAPNFAKIAQVVEIHGQRSIQSPQRAQSAAQAILRDVNHAARFDRYYDGQPSQKVDAWRARAKEAILAQAQAEARTAQVEALLKGAEDARTVTRNLPYLMTAAMIELSAWAAHLERQAMAISQGEEAQL